MDEGKINLLSLLFNKHFGTMPLKEFSVVEDDSLLDELALSLFDFKDMDDFDIWWNEHIPLQSANKLSLAAL